MVKQTFKSIFKAFLVYASVGLKTQNTTQNGIRAVINAKRTTMLINWNGTDRYIILNAAKITAPESVNWISGNTKLPKMPVTISTIPTAIPTTKLALILASMAIMDCCNPWENACPEKKLDACAAAI